MHAIGTHGHARKPVQPRLRLEAVYHKLVDSLAERPVALARQHDDADLVVVAVGACACSGGIFARAYNIQGGIDQVVPVDVYVPGCAARPESIIDGVVQGIAALEQKRRRTA